jgi:hypothetical protein
MVPQPAHKAGATGSGLDGHSTGAVEFHAAAPEPLFTPAPTDQRRLTGAAFAPPSCNGIFSDVTGSNPNCAWIEQLAADEIAQPCEDNGIFGQRFCPDQPVTRGQIAGLLERTMRGTDAWRPEQGDGAVPNLPRALAGLHTVDTGGQFGNDVGQHSSITIGRDGLGLISYYDATGHALKVAHCSNVDCTEATSWWPCMDCIGAGTYSSITIGADGLGLISYYDEASHDLWVAHCSSINCTAAAITALDTANDVGQYSSITIGADGLGLISYWNGSFGWLTKAHCSNPNCTAATINAIDSPVVGQYTSITVGSDGLGLISYYDALQNDLRVYHCPNLNCFTSSTPTVTHLDDGGAYTSIAFGADGLGLISYYSNNDLKVAHCSNVTCTAATITPLDTAGDVGLYTSITIGTDGLGLISYYENTNHDLKVAHCSNPECTSATITALDTVGDVGQYTAITIGADGLGLISYYDATNGDLKVAHCSNVLCTPYFRRR